jgi:chemotaxis methyl-accepting protein methylase
LWQGTCCQHPLGRLFDRYFQSQAAVHAVRARMEQAASALVAHLLEQSTTPYRVLSIGSGPAFDLVRAVEIMPAAEHRRLKITLLDLDAEALDDAQSRLSQRLHGEQIACHRENLFRLPALARAARLVDGHDFAVCLGLFDYLADPPATALLRLMWEGLQPGGMLLVGNFAPHHATRAFMEWFGNWYLLYRTAEQFEQLGLAAGIPAGAFHIGAERFGADLFLVARKPAMTE